MSWENFGKYHFVIGTDIRHERMDEEAMNLGSRTKIQGNSHLYLGPWTLELEKWRAREEVRCLSEAPICD